MLDITKYWHKKWLVPWIDNIRELESIFAWINDWLQLKFRHKYILCCCAHAIYKNHVNVKLMTQALGNMIKHIMETKFVFYINWNYIKFMLMFIFPSSCCLLFWNDMCCVFCYFQCPINMNHNIFICKTTTIQTYYSYKQK